MNPTTIPVEVNLPLEVSLLSLGLLVLFLFGFLQIYDEWGTRGPTDTSYRALACLVVGSAMVASRSWASHHYGAAVVSTAMLADGVYLLWLKARDFIRSRWGI